METRELGWGPSDIVWRYVRFAQFGAWAARKEIGEPLARLCQSASTNLTSKIGKIDLSFAQGIEWEDHLTIYPDDDFERVMTRSEAVTADNWDYMWLNCWDTEYWKTCAGYARHNVIHIYEGWIKLFAKKGFPQFLRNAESYIPAYDSWLSARIDKRKVLTETWNQRLPEEKRLTNRVWTNREPLESGLTIVHRIIYNIIWVKGLGRNEYKRRYELLSGLCERIGGEPLAEDGDERLLTVFKIASALQRHIVLDKAVGLRLPIGALGRIITNNPREGDDNRLKKWINKVNRAVKRAPQKLPFDLLHLLFTDLIRHIEFQEPPSMGVALGKLYYHLIEGGLDVDRMPDKTQSRFAARLQVGDTITLEDEEYQLTAQKDKSHFFTNDGEGRLLEFDPTHRAKFLAIHFQESTTGERELNLPYFGGAIIDPKGRFALIADPSESAAFLDLEVSDEDRTLFLTNFASVISIMVRAGKMPEEFDPVADIRVMNDLSIRVVMRTTQTVPLDPLLLEEGVWTATNHNWQHFTQVMTESGLAHHASANRRREALIQLAPTGAINDLSEAERLAAGALPAKIAQAAASIRRNYDPTSIRTPIETGLWQCVDSCLRERGSITHIPDDLQSALVAHFLEIHRPQKRATGQASRGSVSPPPQSLTKSMGPGPVTPPPAKGTSPRSLFSSWWGGKG